MCRICVEWEMGKLTDTEALRNMVELVADEEVNEHFYNLIEKIEDSLIRKLEEEE